MDFDLRHFHFLHPLWLLALIPLAVMLQQLLRNYLYASNWQRVCDAHLLAHLLTHRPKQKRYWPIILVGLAWFFTIIALAAPTWLRLPQAVYQAQFSRIIVLDLSNNMNASDIPPSRLTHARFKVIDLLKQMKDSRVGMIAFTSEPFVVSPLTQDANTIALLVPTLQTGIMPVQGSNLAAALVAARNLFKQGGAAQGEIMLITASPVQAQDVATVKNLREQGITTSVLGMGTAQGSPIAKTDGGFLTDSKGGIIISKLDSAQLQLLAQAGGGHYAAYSADDQDVSTLLTLSAQQQIALHNHPALSHQTTELWRDEGRWFLVIVVVLTLLGFRRGWLEEIVR